jgi:hypothetical protein
LGEIIYVGIGGKTLLLAAIRPHPINFPIAVAIGDEGDPLPVRRLLGFTVKPGLVVRFCCWLPLARMQ